MPRGGFREGAGRKKEYTEPVRKILLGLPESVLQELDQYANQRNLSRPKAIAALLKQIHRPEEPARQKTTQGCSAGTQVIERNLRRVPP